MTFWVLKVKYFGEKWIFDHTINFLCFFLNQKKKNRICFNLKKKKKNEKQSNIYLFIHVYFIKLISLLKVYAENFNYFRIKTSVFLFFFFFVLNWQTHHFLRKHFFHYFESMKNILSTNLKQNLFYLIAKLSGFMVKASKDY